MHQEEIKNEHIDDCCSVDLDNTRGRSLKIVLYTVLFINLGMFFVEMIGGLKAQSNALLADSLDMLGDSFVYGISIAVLLKSSSVRAKASLVKGITMLSLGLLVVGENIYKIFNPVIPVASTITTIGILALLANAISSALLFKHKSTDLNTKSAWICSRNDVVANFGVIIAGLLVAGLNSMWPDVIVGFMIAGLVIYSSVNIIREAIKHIKR